jgi:undecaprenyl-diphosphatase
MKKASAFAAGMWSGFALGFPSGHTTSAAVFAVILIYLASRARLHAATRLSVQVIAVATMLLVGWARIVLRAHWPTDVLGGHQLGTACAAAAAWWDSTRPHDAAMSALAAKSRTA